jgi:class 3 adenylate cyclase
LATAACPSCGVQNDPAQRFCGACGAALGRTCAACGQDNPPGFRFCGACGTALDAGAPSTPPLAPGRNEERRWATVLFADLSGFTALSEQTDPEEVRSMVDRSMREMGEVVEQFGGSIDKVIGDALMAVFGAPVAHEDDPERAVRVALEIQRRASENADAFGGLCVRIGVNTGEVIFAPVGPESRRQFTVMGDAVNTAARLQAAAPAQGVLVGAETRTASAGAIGYEAVEPIEAKGKAVPLRAWLARSATTTPAERRVSATPFVGRDAELDLLVHAWRRTAGGLHPQLITVLGPPGIGKTRLTREFTHHVEIEGGRALRGRSLPYGERAAYFAFGQIVKDACGIFATDSAAVAGDKLLRRLTGMLPADETAELARHISILAGIAEDEVADRELLFGSAQRFLEALARERPTLLVLEDLQWADRGLLDLVESLSVRLPEVPLLLLALARPEFLDARASWAHLPTAVTLRLEPLGNASAHDLVVRLLSGSPDPESVAQRVERAAGGNPLFIEELSAWLSEGGAADAGELPKTVAALIAARLDRLPAPERQLILDASVIGDVFWRGALEALGADGSQAEILNSLERRDLIRRMPTSRIEGDQELAFKHALIREVAYSTLPKGVRRARHGAVAHFIEEAAGDPAAYAAILAHHWREAGDSAKAVDYLLTAADRAGRGWAHQEAVDLCDQALELVPDGDEPRRRRALMRRAVALQTRLHATFDVRLQGQSNSSGDMSPPIS